MLCIIPARGGSKRIPRKNIKPFLGTPIIRYPIVTAINAGFDVVVTTEDTEIAGVAQEAGADVIYRPEYLAGDGVELEDVLYDLLKDSDRQTACMMLPTSVFIKPEHLEESRDLLTHYQLVYSIVRFDYPVQRAMEVVDGRVRFVTPDHRNSQDIPARYHDAAQFYTFDVMAFCDAWSSGKRILELEAHGIEYGTQEVQDIDTPGDWALAEMKYKARGH